MAAGPWISTAGYGDANQSLVTKLLTVALHSSQKNGAAGASPVMMQILAKDEGLGNLMAALGVQISFADLGQAAAAATAEGTAVSATNTTATNRTLTPARREFARILSDYSRSLQDGIISGQLSGSALGALAMEGTMVWTNTLISLANALAASATYSSGTSGLDLTWEAMQHLNIDMADRGANGLVQVHLDAKGVKDLSDDTLSLGGAVAMSQQVQQFMNAGSSGAYVGRFFGRMDIYMLSGLDTDGADTLGMAFTADGIHTKHQQVPLPAEADSLLYTGFFRQELRRTGGAVTRVETDMYNAAGILQQVAFAKIPYLTA